jgi:hypothetical protein
MHIVIEESKQENLDFENYINKFIHTIDGKLLGTVESVNDNYVIVKKEVIDPLYYYIPKNRFKRWDDHALWIDMSETQFIKSDLSETNDIENKIDIETTTFRLNKSIMNNVGI